MLYKEQEGVDEQLQCFPYAAIIQWGKYLVENDENLNLKIIAEISIHMPCRGFQVNKWEGANPTQNLYAGKLGNQC